MSAEPAWKIIRSDYGQIVIHENDTHIGASIARYGYWMQEEVRSMLAMLEILAALRGDIVCYDIGANIGTHTLAIASSLQEKALVRAFEAQSMMFRMLCETVSLNRLSNVRCHHHAVADVAGIDIDFAMPDYAHAANFGSLELIAHQRSDNATLRRSGMERVRTVSVDLFDERVDFIKLDIEGMESLALRGARRTIAMHRPLIMVEVLKSEPAALAAYFEALSYQVTPRGENWIAIPLEMSDSFVSHV
jgi:FkbM family methyltransferase